MGIRERLDFLPARFPRLPRSARIVDRQSFLRQQEVLDLLVDDARPRLVIEVGTWKGHSAIRMARGLRHPDAAVLCVDTWLGSREHWELRHLRRQLHLKHGYPTLYRRFLSNVLASGLARRIIPLPMTSDAAAQLLWSRRVRADLIYLDGAHDAASVRRDLASYQPLLARGGLLFGDDYDWEGVRRAVREHVAENALHACRLGCYWVASSSHARLARLFARYCLAL